MSNNNLRYKRMFSLIYTRDEYECCSKFWYPEMDIFAKKKLLSQPFANSAFSFAEPVLQLPVVWVQQISGQDAIKLGRQARECDQTGMSSAQLWSNWNVKHKDAIKPVIPRRARIEEISGFKMQNLKAKPVWGQNPGKTCQLHLPSKAPSITFAS